LHMLVQRSSRIEASRIIYNQRCGGGGGSYFSYWRAKVDESMNVKRKAGREKNVQLRYQKKRRRRAGAMPC